MKKFFLVYKEALIGVIAVTLIFILSNTIIWTLSLLTTSAILIYYLILFIKRQSKIKEKFGLSILVFSIFYTLSWTINALLSYAIIVDIITFDVLPKSDGFLEGIEYVFLFILPIIYIIFNNIIQIIYYIIKKIKQKKQQMK